MASGNPYRGLLFTLGAEALVVIVLYAIAESGPDGGKVAVGLLVVLWAMFLIIHSDEVKTKADNLMAGRKAA